MVWKPPTHHDPFRADWRFIGLAALALGGMALLAGCSETTAPTAPEDSQSYFSLTLPAGENSGDSRLMRDPAGLVNLLAVVEPMNGRWLVEGDDASHHIYVMPGQPVQFTWYGVGGIILGTARTYRYGWDVADSDDPDDPGWAVPRGNGDANHKTDEMYFYGGIHELTIEMRDGDILLARVVFGVSAEPVLPRPERDGFGNN